MIVLFAAAAYAGRLQFRGHRKEGVQRGHRLPIFGTMTRSAVLINAQSRFPIVVLDSALEPLRLFHAAFLTVSFLFLSSSGSNAQGKSRALKGCHFMLKKASQRRGELLGGTEEKSIFPEQGSIYAPPPLNI